MGALTGSSTRSGEVARGVGLQAFEADNSIKVSSRRIQHSPFDRRRGHLLVYR